ncbi:NAD(P)/FAD-dependent oxidoreductase [Luteipulveratus halotolerans]|uniref:Thioredoxin reductase n=1 Tax=Luteipulveratus halotolerans TaxID=1631356 RepID=A0A0L6CHU7_9MICO|nr:NAD(P)/FAD-dependent oxidoreductase [Luteipulveratus halotolerans]KNX37376.1 thioredoxin reductase [Luteipulveratus halotolerans]
MSTSQTYDVLVIGGGAAGLSAALVLGRSRRSVVVIDAGEPRNAPAAHMHSFISRDGTPPGELIAIARAELDPYDVDLVDARVAEIDRTATGFAARTDAGDVYAARRVVLATGARDVLPDIPGLASRWGKDVVHCPYCHGWEVRDQRIGVVATGQAAAHQALLFSQLSDRVTVLANGVDLEAAPLADLSARGVRVLDGAVAEVTVADDRITGVRLADGTQHAFDALVVATLLDVRNPVVDQVGVELTDLPGIGQQVQADEMGRTSVDGVWAVGNAANPMLQVINAAASGNMTGAVLNMDLIQEDLRRARVD